MNCGVIECSAWLSLPLRVDGGVSSNDFVMQLTANLFGRKVARPQHIEMSCLGAAFVAGLGTGRLAFKMHSVKTEPRERRCGDCLRQLHVSLRPPGFWRTRDELKRLNCTDKVFLPQKVPGGGPRSSAAEYAPVFQSWERALHRSMNWYGKT